MQQKNILLTTIFIFISFLSFSQTIDTSKKALPYRPKSRNLNGSAVEIIKEQKKELAEQKKELAEQKKELAKAKRSADEAKYVADLLMGKKHILSDTTKINK
jgi:hypothetical protein